jgi:hypothetical protein
MNNNKRNNNRKNRRPKNTTNFNPDHKEPSMRIKIGDGNLKHFNQDFTENDVIIISNLFTEDEQYQIYHELLNEISNCDGIQNIEEEDMKS